MEQELSHQLHSWIERLRMEVMEESQFSPSTRRKKEKLLENFVSALQDLESNDVVSTFEERSETFPRIEEPTMPENPFYTEQIPESTATTTQHTNLEAEWNQYPQSPTITRNPTVENPFTSEPIQEQEEINEDHLFVAPSLNRTNSIGSMTSRITYIPHPDRISVQEIQESVESVIESKLKTYFDTTEQEREVEKIPICVENLIQKTPSLAVLVGEDDYKPPLESDFSRDDLNEMNFDQPVISFQEVEPRSSGEELTLSNKLSHRIGSFKQKSKKKKKILQQNEIVPTKIIKRGHMLLNLNDIYYFLLSLDWLYLLCCVCVSYLTVAFVFALIFLIGDNCISQSKGNFLNILFFSIHTLSTIGYGNMFPNPSCVHTNFFVIVEALCGLLILGTISGLIFAKFARTKSHIEFSKNAVITDYDGMPVLLLRLANHRLNSVIESKVALTLLQRDKPHQEGLVEHQLKLVQDHTQLFRYGWTLIHPIDKKSPLYESKELLEQKETKLIVTFVGIDPLFSSHVATQYVYTTEHIKWNHRFADMIVEINGEKALDFSCFHKTVPIPERNELNVQENATEPAFLRYTI